MLSVFFYLICSLFHNSNLFGSCIIHILYTECAKIKKNNSGTKRLIGLLLFSTCFGQLCAHYQEKIPYLCDIWYLSLYIDDCLVCRAEFRPAYRTVIWIPPCIPDKHLFIVLRENVILYNAPLVIYIWKWGKIKPIFLCLFNGYV